PPPRASVFALPFLPSSGETVTLGFKNVTTVGGVVHVTPYTPAGAPYALGTTAITVAGLAERQVNLSSLLGAAPAGGWIHVDTRDVTTLDPVTGEPTPTATTGFIFPYISRRIGSGSSAEADSIAGLVPRADTAHVAVFGRTLQVQLVNHSVTEMAPGSVPLAVTFDVDVIGADGTTVASSVVPVPANGSVSVPFTPPVGAIGFVRATPMTPAAAGELYRFSIASRESTIQVHAEGRYRELRDADFPSLVDIGFDVEFGLDGVGNIHDFGLMMSNTSSATQTVTLRAILRSGGTPLLVTPRQFTLPAGRAVFMGTTNTLSAGLVNPEVSWFSDLFGDVFSFGGFEAVTLVVQAPREVDLSARHFDASGTAFYRVLSPIPLTNRACVTDCPVATSTLSGTRSWITITNPTSGELVVPVRAYTPALGTEYLLPDLVVPAFTRFDWSPDGIQLREEPTDTVGPFVTRLRIDLTPSTGALFNGRVESREVAGALNFIRPEIVRSN
ncbi:MAG: hypothetical protein P1V36_00595, partial [Planctomycetota bacterium]|nr:hypothetical protein [Planctomycetota bacterium]